MERVWLTRLRWRIRGAWLGPAFALLLVVDTVLLHELPIAGQGPNWVGALLLALFFQLIAVAGLGRLAGRLVRRRRPDLPRVVARSYGGTAMLVLVTVLLAGVGLAHRGERERERDAFARQSAVVRAWVAREAAAEYRRNVDRATVLRFGDGLYRTCVPSDDSRRALCLFVDMDATPPGIRVDPNRAPNATLAPRAQP